MQTFVSRRYITNRLRLAVRRFPDLLELKVRHAIDQPFSGQNQSANWDELLTENDSTLGLILDGFFPSTIMN